MNKKVKRKDQESILTKHGNAYIFLKEEKIRRRKDSEW